MQNFMERSKLKHARVAKKACGCFSWNATVVSVEVCVYAAICIGFVADRCIVNFPGRYQSLKNSSQTISFKTTNVKLVALEEKSYMRALQHLSLKEKVVRCHLCTISDTPGHVFCCLLFQLLANVLSWSRVNSCSCGISPLVSAFNTF